MDVDNIHYIHNMQDVVGIDMANIAQIVVVDMVRIDIAWIDIVDIDKMPHIQPLTLTLSSGPF